MRHAPTEAERRLWYALRARRFAQFKFRRQMPIGPFIADFVCCSHRLVIELDGSQHAENARDQRRDAWFARAGFRVLRIWNGEMMTRPADVLEGIWAALAPPPFPPAAPAPSPARGEGLVTRSLAFSDHDAAGWPQEPQR